MVGSRAVDHNPSTVHKTSDLTKILALTFQNLGTQQLLRWLQSRRMGGMGQDHFRRRLGVGGKSFDEHRLPNGASNQRFSLNLHQSISALKPQILALNTKQSL